MERQEDLTDPASRVLPYSAIEGQEELKLALEVTYVSPRLGGVLLSGEPGTGKSTIVRAFSLMIHGKLPVTLPINATEDRVVGGRDIAKALQGEDVWKEGLLNDAGKDSSKILYVDEVNLLDDHIVNILLDVTSTGVLEVQRDGFSRPPENLDLTLVGTMNPEEGGLRPQLLDRFALVVQVRTEVERRSAVLKQLLAFDEAQAQRERGEGSEFLKRMKAGNAERRQLLETARQRLSVIPDAILDKCVKLASEVKTEGHRGERSLALAAQAYAAIKGDEEVHSGHLRAVAAMALRHRQKGTAERQSAIWSDYHKGILDRVLG